MNRALVLLAVGCSPVSPDPNAAVSSFQEIHPHIYQVYALPMDRDQVWGLLAGVFVGEALTREYVEHWTNKARMAAEHTAIDVRRVDHDRLEVVEVGEEYVHIDVAWSVGGIVSHQGHKHPRVNRYEAVYTWVWTQDGWRIAGTAMRDVARAPSAAREADLFTDEPERGGYLDPLDLLDAGLGADSDAPAPQPPGTP